MSLNHTGGYTSTVPIRKPIATEFDREHFSFLDFLTRSPSLLSLGWSCTALWWDCRSLTWLQSRGVSMHEIPRILDTIIKIGWVAVIGKRWRNFILEDLKGILKFRKRQCGQINLLSNKKRPWIKIFIFIFVVCKSWCCKIANKYIQYKINKCVEFYTDRCSSNGLNIVLRLWLSHSAAVIVRGGKLGPRQVVAGKNMSPTADRSTTLK